MSMATSSSSSFRISFINPKHHNHHHHPLLHRPISIPIRTRRFIRSNSTTTNEPSTSSLSLYDLLGISETGSSLVEIKKAYKQLARKYHPDVSPPGRSEEYTKRFIRVQEAYETLSDPTRRALYDHLVFSNSANKKRSFCYNARNFQGMEDDKEQWKNRWQAQVSELKKRSMDKEDAIRRRSNANNIDMSMSWGARMRQQMTDSSEED